MTEREVIKEVMKSLGVQESALDFMAAAYEGCADYGEPRSERGQETLRVFAGLLGIAKEAGVKPAEAVAHASYITYAFLGGQAARNVNFGPQMPFSDPIREGVRQDTEKEKTRKRL